MNLSIFKVRICISKFSCCTESIKIWEIKIWKLFHLDSDTEGTNYCITTTASFSIKMMLWIECSFPSSFFFLGEGVFVVLSVSCCQVVFFFSQIHFLRDRFAWSAICVTICNFRTKSNRIHQLYCWLPNTFTCVKTPKWFKWQELTVKTEDQKSPKKGITKTIFPWSLEKTYYTFSCRLRKTEQFKVVTVIK